jgi:hypothetical protein
MMLYREYPDFAFPKSLWPKGGVGQNLTALISLVRMRRPSTSRVKTKIEVWLVDKFVSAAEDVCNSQTIASRKV